MRFFVPILFALCCAAWCAPPASAQSDAAVHRQFVTVCPASQADSVPPAPDHPDCQQVPRWTIDPQGRHLWAYFTLTLDEVPANRPLGLSVSAKASSHAYLNGVKIGENGQPADDRRAEKPGKMDVIFPVPADLLHPGDNALAVRMSSHSGWLTLSSPVHRVALDGYQSPQYRMLNWYWPSFLTFGAFILGALYFLRTASLGRQCVPSLLLALMSTAAALQLLVEVSRGLLDYNYPIHDLRLIAIAGLSATFGLTLATFVIWRFRPAIKWWLVGGAAACTVAALVLPSGFDAKSGLALLAPPLFATGVALSAVRTRLVDALVFAGCLLLFASINLFAAGQFLDRYFYFAIAALMLFLFIQQADGFAREESLRQQEQSRADRLQYVIDRIETSDAVTFLSVRDMGRTHRISSQDIAYIKGAGDFVELVLTSGETHLHSATLNDLEDELPAYFLRVHRSYIANSKLIESLQRNASGTGELRLHSNHALPVSRRIMPKIKAALQ